MFALVDHKWKKNLLNLKNLSFQVLDSKAESELCSVVRAREK